MEDNQIVIYQTEDGQTQVDVRLEYETVWLAQKQIAELFGTKRPAITKHIKKQLQTKFIAVNPRHCEACWQCVEACQHGAIQQRQ